MKQHIAKVSAICFYHLRQLRQICRRVSTAVTIRLSAGNDHVAAELLQLCAGELTEITTEPLQRVPNAAVRLIYELSRREHISLFYVSYTGCQLTRGYSSSCVF